MSQLSDVELAERLRDPLARGGLLVEGVDVQVAGSRRKVTIQVDLADEASTEAVGMEEIAQATRLVDEELGEDGLFDGKPYTLEITSPGAARALTETRHFRRALGRRLSIAREGSPVLLARLREVDEQGIEVHDEKRDEVHRIEFEQITEAKVEVEFK